MHEEEALIKLDLSVETVALLGREMPEAVQGMSEDTTLPVRCCNHETATPPRCCP